eukprot:5094755-Amphidinium_carterae.1
MHPPTQLSLRALRGPEHGSTKSGEDGQSSFASAQSFVLSRRAKHSFVALLRGLEGGTPDGSFHQPSFLHKDHVVQLERQAV